MVAKTCCYINLLNEGEIQLVQLQIKDLDEAQFDGRYWIPPC